MTGSVLKIVGIVSKGNSELSTFKTKCSKMSKITRENYSYNLSFSYCPKVILICINESCPDDMHPSSISQPEITVKTAIY